MASETYPGWIWMLFGLAIGLAVAVAVYVHERPESLDTLPPLPEGPNVSLPSLEDLPIDLSRKPEEAEPEQKESRFKFYEMLPEVNFPNLRNEQAQPQSSSTSRAPEPRSAYVAGGTYELQAGSFTSRADAERRRAEIGMLGVQSFIEHAVVNNRDYYRVLIGPFDDPQSLEDTDRRLRSANIDALRKRIE